MYQKPHKALEHFHRYRGYDYSRGAVFFISLSTSPRRRLFGTPAPLVAAFRRVATSHTIISGFISPAERAVFDALAETPGAQLVKVLPSAMYHDYQPGVGLMPAIAAKRLAIIARGNSEVEFTRGACLDLNAAIIPIAKHHGRALWWRSDGGFEWL